MEQYYVVLVIVLSLHVLCCGQVILFDDCASVKTMEYFEIERFLGKWYTIERFPTLYEKSGQCTYKLIQQCGRTIQFLHRHVKEDIEYFLHINSSYAPGAEAVFVIPENSIDPLGIPLSIIRTDYTNYAIVYGCKFNPLLNIKYVLAWILSRNTTLEPELFDNAYRELNSLPAISLGFMEPVSHQEESCNYRWTAHIQAIYYNDTDNIL